MMKGLLKKYADGLYLGGAAISLFAAAPFAIRYSDVFRSLPWRELTFPVAAPWTAIGAGELGQVMKNYENDRRTGIKPNTAEKIGRALRAANLAAYPIAFAADKNALYSLGLTGALTVAGHCIEEVGKYFRERNYRQ